jgi:hypothetical protein
VIPTIVDETLEHAFLTQYRDDEQKCSPASIYVVNYLSGRQGITELILEVSATTADHRSHPKMAIDQDEAKEVASHRCRRRLQYQLGSYKSLNSYTDSGAKTTSQGAHRRKTAEETAHSPTLHSAGAGSGVRF